MNKLVLTNLAIFAGGAIIGSAVTYGLLKTKYEKIAQEEIDSVKELYSKKYAEKAEPEIEEIEEEPSMTVSEIKEQVEKLQSEKSNMDVIEYAKKLSENEYLNDENEKEEKIMDYNVPQVISPDEFCENPDYDVVSLTYYADDVITDEDDIPIQDEDIDDMIGYESLTSFGRYEDDSVFVRNDEYETYYEILRDLRNYADI